MATAANTKKIKMIKFCCCRLVPGSETAAQGRITLMSGSITAAQGRITLKPGGILPKVNQVQISVCLFAVYPDISSVQSGF